MKTLSSNTPLHIAWVLVALASPSPLACSGESDGGTDLGQADSLVAPDLPDPPDLVDVPPDTITDTTDPADTVDTIEPLPDTGPEEVYVPEPGELGWPCEDNADCNGSWCLTSAEGKLCSQSCTTTCPAGWDCR